MVLNSSKYCIMLLGDELMSVLINKKRCDNANVCSCIAECPTKAFYWDEKKQSVAVDNSLCINCRQCMIACEAGAVKVARSKEEYNKIKTEYDEDVMTIKELFQDRYGASPVNENYTLELNDLHQLIKDSNKTLLIEFYNDDEARCLINSIPINDFIKTINIPISYRKINVSDVSTIKEYSIDILPSFLVIADEKIVFAHNGFVDSKNKEKLLNKLKDKFDDGKN